MATQKGRNWSSGDIVTAANLSSIERGVSAVAEEYTPTTWANGDTVTAAALNNIEQGIANAGGGSSDFSTAEVVVINNLQNDAVVLVVAHVTTGPTEATMGVITVQSLATPNITVALYKSTALCLIANPDAPIQNVSVSGNAEFVPDEGGVIITGDCTITIS